MAEAGILPGILLLMWNMVTYVFQDIVPFGNNVLFRWVFGWMMPPEVSLLKLTQPEAVTRLYNKAHVIQDMLVPVEKLQLAIDKFHQEFQVNILKDK